MATPPDRFDQLLAAAEAPAPDRFDELLAVQERGGGGDRFDALLAAVEQPAAQRSFLNRISGGLIQMRGDPGFAPVQTGFAPLQFAQAVQESPELQAAGARMGGAITGAAMGAPLGPVGAIVGGLGGAFAAEPLARSLTPREETLTESATNVAFGGLAIPAARVGTFSERLAQISPRLEQAAREAALGAAISGGQTGANTLLTEGRLPMAEEYLPTMAGGALVGGPLGAALSPPASAMVQPAAPVELPATLQPKPPSLANVAAKAANASEMAGNTNLQQVVSEMSGVTPPAMSPTFQSGLFEPQQTLPDELRVVGQAMDQVAAQQAALGMTGGTAGDVNTLRRGLAPLAVGVEPTIPSPKLPEPVTDDEALRVAKAMMGVVEPTVSSVALPEPAPVAAAMPEPLPAATAKETMLRNALKQDGIDYQYVVFRPGPGYPDAIQVDILSPDRTQSLGSSNPAELNKLGAKIPTVPDWVPQGRYTREELEALVEQGPPSTDKTAPAPPASQAGFITPQLASTVGGGAAGGATGFATTERQEGESEEQFQARRLGNAFIGAVVGAGLGAGAGMLKRNPVPPTASPVLKKLNTVLTAKDKPEPTMFERVQDAVGNFRYRFNTSWAPVGEAQKQIYKLAGRDFKAGRYYDLERAGERLAGAPVKAQREVEQLFNLINDLDDTGKVKLRQFITLSRIQDRLARIPEETARLQDAVGRAQSTLGLAKTAIQRQEAKVALNAAIDDLNENADRLRVGDWTLDETQKGLADLRAETDPALFATIEQKAEDYQSIMREVLRKRVESGLMSQDLMNQLVESTDFYAPFKVLKHFDPERGQMYPGGGRKAFTSGQLVRKITGIDDVDVRLADPLEPSAEQIYKSTLQNEKNLYMRRLATLTKLPGSEDYIREVPEGQVAEKGFQKVPYFTNGEKRYLEVKDDIYEALTGPYSLPEKNIAISAAEKAGAVFRAGATQLSIPFQIANAAIFDPARLALISKAGLRANPLDWARFVASDYPQALLASIRTSVGRPNELGEQWLASGAASSTFNRVFTPEAFVKELPKETTLAERAKDSLFGLKTVRDMTAVIGNTLEQTAKIAGMKRLMRFEGVDKLPPLQRARKLEEIATEIRNYAGSPDFLRSGADVRVLNTLLPFLNARWQGFTSDLNRLTSLDSPEGKAALMRLTAAVGVPAAGLAYWNLLPENEGDFSEIPEDERKRYFHIPYYLDKEGNKTFSRTQEGQPLQRATFKTADGTELRDYFRLPKREFPQLMANTGEALVQWLKTEDPSAFDNLGETLLNVATPVSLEGDGPLERTLSAVSGVNPLFRTPVELAANKDFFRNAEIVPESRLKGPAALQYRPSTPEVYRNLGEQLNLSPARLQKVAEDITGGFVRQFVTPQGEDKGMADRFFSRFSRSERVNEAPMRDAAATAQSQRVEERVYATETAKGLVDEIVAIGQQHGPQAMQEYGRERLRLAIQNGVVNKETMDEVEAQLKEQLMGYTNEQKYVRQNVPKAVRGQYYAERVKQMTPDEAGAYIEDAMRKGLMDNEVAAEFQQALKSR